MRIRNNKAIKILKKVTFYFLLFTFIQALSYKTGVRGNQIAYAMNWEDIFPLLPEIMLYSFIMSLILLLYLNSFKKVNSKDNE